MMISSFDTVSSPPPGSQIYRLQIEFAEINRVWCFQCWWPGKTEFTHQLYLRFITEVLMFRLNAYDKETQLPFMLLRNKASLDQDVDSQRIFSFFSSGRLSVCSIQQKRDFTPRYRSSNSFLWSCRVLVSTIWCLPLSVQINRGSPAADSSSFYHLHFQGIASQVQSGSYYLGVGLNDGVRVGVHFGLVSESVLESIQKSMILCFH